MVLIQGNGPERRTAVETVLSFDADWMQGQCGRHLFRCATARPSRSSPRSSGSWIPADGGLSQNLVKLQPIARLNAILVVARKPELLQDRANLDQAARQFRHLEHRREGLPRALRRCAQARQAAQRDVRSARRPRPIDSARTSSRRAPASRPPRQRTGGSLSRAGAAVDGASPAVRRPARQQNDAAALAPNAAGAGPRATAPLRQRQPAALLPGVRITADVTNNSLLIYANQENYRIIEQTLRQIDRPQLQVVDRRDHRRGHAQRQPELRRAVFPQEHRIVGAHARQRARH